MAKTRNLKLLRQEIRNLYKSKTEELPFHGWHHVSFVTAKAIEFAKIIGANLYLVEAASLVHDLNYLVTINSEPEQGELLRKQILLHCGFLNNEIECIEHIILDAHTLNRVHLSEISLEVQALSDADTLYKALPVTPILFAHQYLAESQMQIGELAEQIVRDQLVLLKTDRYFYTEIAKKKYIKWAETNLVLWENVLDAIKDPEIIKLLSES